VICLQGGAEFGADCIAMDRLLVEAARDAGRTGDIVVTALAGASGFEYDTANNNGIRHFSSIVKSVYGNDDAPSVIAAPDARGDEAGAQAALRSASIIVLPGGSPSRLLSALIEHNLDQLLKEFLDGSGGILMGASAGAMVLCEQTWLPDRGKLAAGLALVPGCLVLPHFSAGGLGRLDSFGGASPAITVLGLPEQSGLIVQTSSTSHTALVMTSVGAKPSTVIKPNSGEQLLALGQSLTVEVPA